MCSLFVPGGAFRKGAVGQEECLFRRTTLPHSLCPKKNFYPMTGNAAIFSKNVLVFRSNEEEGYAFLDEPFYVNVLSAASLKHPDMIPIEGTKPTEYRMTSKNENEMKGKIRTILTVAALNNVKNLILSAFGCGAYGCPPNHVAALFKEVIQDFYGVFDNIIFAIFNDANSRRRHNPKGNVLPFKEVFGLK